MKRIRMVATCALVALSCGSTTVAYLSDSLMRKMKSSAVIRPVQDGKLVLLSVVKPDAGFQAGIAMMRNRYIYAQSSGTVIVRSDYNKGGTWSGAVENLKYGWCPEFCWDQKHIVKGEPLIREFFVSVWIYHFSHPSFFFQFNIAKCFL